MVVLMCVVMVLPVSATSADKVYRVDHLDVLVSLTDTGDAVITENWTLTYSKGEFSRFYKHLFSTGYFDDEISILSVKINGEEVPPAEGSERRPHNTYETGLEDGNTTIQWYYHVNPTSPTVVEYSITYKLYNAVAKYKNNAYFKYQLVGTGFDKKIIKTTITVKTPNSTPFEVKGKPVQWRESGNVITIREHQKNDLVFILKMDKKAFRDIGKCGWWSIQSPSTQDNITMSGVIIVLFILIYIASTLETGNNNNNRRNSSSYHSHGCSSCGGCGGGGCGGCGGAD